MYCKVTRTYAQGERPRGTHVRTPGAPASHVTPFTRELMGTVRPVVSVDYPPWLLQRLQ